MIKWKIVLVLALYITLGILGYFSFGFHNLMIEKVGGKGGSNGSAWKKLEKNMTNIQSDVPQQSQDSLSDQGTESGENQDDP
jgi:hypothetical protein